MTLRYGHDGKPCGLDWSVCSDGNPRPEVWDSASRIRPKEEAKPTAVRTSPPASSMRQRIPEEKERLIIRLYTEQMLSGLQVSQRAGCSVVTVFNVLHRNGVPVRSSGRTAAQ